MQLRLNLWLTLITALTLVMQTYGMKQPDEAFFTDTLATIKRYDFKVETWWHNKSLDEQEKAKEYLPSYLCSDLNLNHPVKEVRRRVKSVVDFLIKNKANVRRTYIDTIHTTCYDLEEDREYITPAREYSTLHSLIENPKRFNKLIVKNKAKIEPEVINTLFQGKTLFDPLIADLCNAYEADFSCENFSDSLSFFARKRIY